MFVRNISKLLPDYTASRPGYHTKNAKCFRNRTRDRQRPCPSLSFPVSYSKFKIRPVTAVFLITSFLFKSLEKWGTDTMRNLWDQPRIAVPAPHLHPSNKGEGGCRGNTASRTNVTQQSAARQCKAGIQCSWMCLYANEPPWLRELSLSYCTKKLTFNKLTKCVRLRVNLWCV
jgi:hypothetical protein